MIARVWRNLQSYAVGARRWFVALIGTSAIGGLAEAAALLIALRVALALNADGENGSVDVPLVGLSLGAGTAIALAAITAVVAFAAHFAVAWQSAVVSATVLTNARAAALRGFVEADWSTQARQREGALQEVTSNLCLKTSVLAQALAVGASQVVTLATFVAAALIVEPMTTLGVVAAGLAIILGLRPVTRLNHLRSEEFVEANSTFAEEVSRLSSASLELKAFGVERNAGAALALHNEEVGARFYRSRLIMQFGSNMLKDLAVLLLVGCIGVLALVNGSAVGGIGVVIALVVRSLASAQAANSAYHSVLEGAPNLEGLNRHLATLRQGAAVTGAAPLESIATIELREVGYRYADELPVLERISLDLRFGEALGILGPSGGGKSTLMQVLLRLRPPTCGAVLVNGQDYLTFDGESWARLLAFVPQEPTLLEGSIADNIRYYREFDRDEIEQAAHDANVLADILRLPSGFDTLLGPRGTGLSGGQKQRVAIARALIGSPQLLVMDEPSSALDIRSEELLHDAITRLKGKTTMVIVAHRLTTVSSCDRLVVLEHGRIAQTGSPSELLKADGFYRDVHAMAVPVH